MSIGSKILLIQSCMQRLDGNFECQITPKRGPDMKKQIQIGQEMTKLALQK